MAETVKMAETHQSGMSVSRAIGGRTANSMELPTPTMAKQANNNLNVGRGVGVVGSGEDMGLFFIVS
jgi:hypothetical protein